MLSRNHFGFSHDRQVLYGKSRRTKDDSLSNCE